MDVHQPFKLDEKPSGQTDQVKQRRFLLQRRILVEHAGVLEPAAERMAPGRQRRDMSFVTARCMLTRQWAPCLQFSYMYRVPIAE